MRGLLVTGFVMLCAIPSCHHDDKAPLPLDQPSAMAASSTATATSSTPPAPTANPARAWLAKLGPYERPQKVDYHSLDPATARITLSRDQCYGTCPVYTLTLTADGKVTFDGKEYVESCGHRTGKVPAEAVRKLVGQIEKIDYFSLGWDSPCQDGMATDNPTVSTSVQMSGVRRAIRDYHGDRCVPEALRWIERRIDEVAGAYQWVSCRGGCTRCSDRKQKRKR